MRSMANNMDVVFLGLFIMAVGIAGFFAILWRIWKGEAEHWRTMYDLAKDASEHQQVLIDEWIDECNRRLSLVGKALDGVDK